MKDSHDRPSAARFRPEMDSENSADHVFVDIDAEGQSDLLGNALGGPRCDCGVSMQRPRRSALWSGLWDSAGGPVRVKTAVGTFAWSAFHDVKLLKVQTTAAVVIPRIHVVRLGDGGFK